MNCIPIPGIKFWEEMIEERIFVYTGMCIALLIIWALKFQKFETRLSSDNKKINEDQAWWGLPVILSTQEVEIRRITVQDHSRQKVRLHLNKQAKNSSAPLCTSQIHGRCKWRRSRLVPASPTLGKT
jgi:hypothetical protein